MRQFFRLYFYFSISCPAFFVPASLEELVPSNKLSTFQQMRRHARVSNIPNVSTQLHVVATLRALLFLSKETRKQF